MTKQGWVAAIVVILLIAGGAWWYFSQPVAAPSGAAGINGSNNQGNLGGTDTGTPQTPGGTASTTPGASSGAGDGTSVGQNLILGVNAGSGDIANFLSAYNGMTLYTYSPDTDTPGKSACSGTCAANWPPYTVSSASDIHVSAATTGAVSTITRTDGTLQVTYKGQPLYFYIKDKKPGNTTGEGVGGVWYIVHP